MLPFMFTVVTLESPNVIVLLVVTLAPLPMAVELVIPLAIDALCPMAVL